MTMSDLDGWELTPHFVRYAVPGRPGYVHIGQRYTRLSANQTVEWQDRLIVTRLQCNVHDGVCKA